MHACTGAHWIVVYYHEQVCLNMQVQVEKSSMGWELEELEQAAHLVAAEDSTQRSEEEEEDEQEPVTSSSNEEDTESESCEGDCRDESSSDAETGNERNARQASDWGNCIGGSMTTTAGNARAVVGESIDKSPVEHIDNARNEMSSHTEAVFNEAKTVQENNSVGLEKESISARHPKPTSAPKSGHSMVNETSTLHSDSLCDHDIGGLTEDLHTLLTLQPHQQHTTSAQNLIEEIN